MIFSHSDKCKVPIFLLFFLLCISEVNAGPISDSIQQECPKQYAQFEQTVQEFAIRMQDNIEAYGCGVISAYGVFAKNNMDRIMQWEDNEQSFESVSEVFFLADQYQLDIASKPVLFDALQALLAGNNNDQWYEKIDQLLSYTTHSDRRRMSREPERILYLMWATRIEPNQSPKITLHKARYLRKDFPLKKLPIALILDSQILMVYPTYNAKQRLNIIHYVFQTYPIDFITKVTSSKLALPNMVYLLPPQVGDIKGSQGLTDRDLKRLSNDYSHSFQEIVISFEIAFKSSNDAFGAAIDAASVLAPFIQQALIKAPEMSITKYLKNQIHAPVFEHFIRYQSDCGANNISHIVAQFFTFLAPQKTNAQKVFTPINYLQNNLAMIANWYHDDGNGNMRRWILDERNNPKAFIQNMAQLPYYYQQSSLKSRRYMSKLLSNLPGSINTNASFILALYQSTKYFDWLDHATDANAMIIANQAIGDASAPKYRYILTTPFPSQNDTSVFQRHFSNRASLSVVSLLYNYTEDELSKHEFTQKEKVFSMLGNVDNTIMAISIAAVPLTGGASLLIAGGSVAAKLSAKKGLKYAMKSGFRYVRKTALNNSQRTIRRLLGKDGKKLMQREFKELTNMAPKRGRLSLYAKNQGEMTKSIHNVSNHSNLLQMGLATSSIALAIYCDKFAKSSSYDMDPKLCRVRMSKPSTVNQCQNFNIRNF